MVTPPVMTLVHQFGCCSRSYNQMQGKGGGRRMPGSVQGTGLLY